MSLWVPKTIVLLAIALMVAIRAPHARRCSAIPVRHSRRGALDAVVLALAWIATFLPLLWIATKVLAFADYPLHPLLLVAGSSFLALGLWLFQRSHADLGTNWSITLELREQHQLITRGVYRWSRHPMYMALLVYSVGLALVLPNWVAGPSYLLAMLVVIAARLRPEERMLREEFGERFDAYAKSTRCLIPGIW